MDVGTSLLITAVSAVQSRINFSPRCRLPVVLQSELAECGLACLSMVSAFHGYNTNLNEMRRLSNISLKGSTLRSLTELADRIGLTARALRIEVGDLRSLTVPAILHWDLDHYVVLKKAKRRGIVIHDPARGHRVVDNRAVEKSFSGVALELAPARRFVRKAKPDRVRFRDLWARSRGVGLSIAQIVLLSAFLQVLALISPLVNQLVVDEAIAKNDMNFLQAVLLGFGLLLLAQTAIETLRSNVGLFFEQSLNFQLRSNLLRHVLRLTPEFFEKRHIGDIVSRIESLEPVQKLISSAVVTVLLDGVLGIATLIVMYVYSPLLALMVLGITLLSLVVRLASFPYFRRLTEEKIHANANLQSMLLETIRAVRSVKLFGREIERHAQWQNVFVDATNIGIRLQKFGIRVSAGSRLIFGGLDLAVFYVGAQAVIGGTMTLGMFFAFQSYRSQFNARSAALLRLYLDYKTVGVHLERLADIIHADQEPNHFGSAVSAHDLRGRIDITGVNFRYGADQPWILDSISTHIEAGEKIALVGRSGCGKTTLVKILLGLLQPQFGDVRYDGHTLSHIGLRDFRRRVGVVMQDDRLLSGSLLDNICFFDAAPNMDKIVHAARMANIYDEIIAMPMGFNSFVGDMGSALSSGQIQRILLARALYDEPAILFLDEGTANLDSSNECEILATLKNHSATQIIVAHRPAAIKACDRILLVSQGTVQQVTAAGYYQTFETLQ